MALTTEEQELFDLARAALPHWLFDNDRANEELGMFAKMLGRSRLQVAHWLSVQAFIQQATGATSDEPDWLDLHARDRGSRRQADETDVALRARITNVADAIARGPIMEAVQAILDAEGISGTPYMVELPHDQAYLTTNTLATGTGGSVNTITGTTRAFYPTAGFPYPPYFAGRANPGDPLITIHGRVVSTELVISGAASGGNNGTFAITGLNGNGAKYVNATAVAGIDAGLTWTVRRKGPDGVVIDGWADAYLDRGFRMGRARGAMFILILPIGATASTEAAVREMLRLKKGAGVVVVIERRMV